MTYSAAIHKAVETLKTNSRQGSVRAVVLFTDGPPSDGQPLDSDPWQNARKGAMAARKEGIAIYTIISEINISNINFRDRCHTCHKHLPSLRWLR
jgi:Mg-chelatase subunit ChlD